MPGPPLTKGSVETTALCFSGCAVCVAVLSNRPSRPRSWCSRIDLIILGASGGSGDRSSRFSSGVEIRGVLENWLPKPLLGNTLSTTPSSVSDHSLSDRLSFTFQLVSTDAFAATRGPTSRRNARIVLRVELSELLRVMGATLKSLYCCGWFDRAD